MDLQTYEIIIKVLLAITFVLATVSLILNFIFNKCTKFQKITSVSGFVALLLFVPVFYKLFAYITEVYGVYFTSSFVITIINILLLLLAVVFTTINFFKKGKEKLIRIIELSSLLISVILIITSILMQYSDKIFIVITAISLIFCEYFIVNANEKMQDKTSKIIYLTTNIIVSAILIICLLILVFKISFSFDLTLLFIGLIILIIALIPLLNAYKTLKKEENND